MKNLKEYLDLDIIKGVWKIEFRLVVNAKIHRS